MCDCPKCLGNGEIETVKKEASQDFEAIIVPCPLCNGVGSIETV